MGTEGACADTCSNLLPRADCTLYSESLVDWLSLRCIQLIESRITTTIKLTSELSYIFATTSQQEPHDPVVKISKLIRTGTHTCEESDPRDRKYQKEPRILQTKQQQVSKHRTNQAGSSYPVAPDGRDRADATSRGRADFYLISRPVRLA